MFNKRKVVSITLALGVMLITSTVGHAASFKYSFNLNSGSKNCNSNYNFYDNISNKLRNYNWKVITMPANQRPDVPVKPETPETPDKPSTPDKTDSKPTSPETNPGISEMEMEVVKLVNAERQKAGLTPFTASSELSKVARIKSEDMAKNNYFSHTSPTYGSPFDMMKKFGIKYNTAGENIAKGYSSAQAVVNGWMNSSGHRANILNPSFKTIGVGAYSNNGTIYWTQMFTN